MTNGNGMPRLPGIFVGGGFGISTGAILVGTIGILAAMWLANSMTRPRIPTAGQLENEVMADVYAYATNPVTVQQNIDRIREAITRARSAFRVALDAYIKKIRDLHTALRNGTITREQYRTQRLAAHQEFRAAIKARHKEIMDALGVPRRRAGQDDDDERPPTTS
jgi:hypothetical protein